MCQFSGLFKNTSDNFFFRFSTHDTFLPDTPVCRAELAQYYQSVSRIDQGVGRLVDILQKAGRLDDTLIVFMSDHGIAFPGSKTTLYDPGMRIPLIVRGPGVTRRGASSEALVSIADITPTLLDFAGSGVVTRIWLTVTDRGPEMLRSLRLEMFWDGAETPAVSVPLGDFFGIGPVAAG